jgi:hypothetical protein
VSTLVAGDTLHLAAGNYGLLAIRNVNGMPSSWITITGPASGAPATFHADPGPCCNTVEIADSSYVALQNVTVDGGHVDGAFGISAQTGVVHDIVAYVYDNTIYATASGIRFGNRAPDGDGVVDNLIFAGTPIAGPIADSRDNLTLAVSDAASYVTAPTLVLGQMDFYPLADKCEGAPSDPSKFADDVDYDRDFNGTSRGAFTFRGAYAGSGKNPGWPLGSGIKAAVTPLDGGAGEADGAAGSTGGSNAAGRSDSGGRSGAGSGGASANAGGTGTAAPDASVTSASAGVPVRVDGGSSAAPDAGDSSACGCRTPHGAPGSGSAVAGVVWALLGLFVRRRRQLQRNLQAL